MSVGSKAIYQPRDNGDIQALVDANPLAWIICGSPSAFAVTPIPVQLRCDDDGRPNMLVGHFARGNPQLAQLAATPDALVLLMGPQSYVSPSWFDDRTQAPTWNYACAVFHVHVVLEDEPATVAQRLDDLVMAMESNHTWPWSSSEMGARYTSLSRGVVGFHAPIHEVRASFKLGQDERDDVFADILAGLDTRGEHDLVSWMEHFAGPVRLDVVAAARKGSNAPLRIAGAVPASDRPPLDPQIEHFVRAVTEDNRRLSVDRTLDWPQRRIIAEQSRTPWAQGGPRIPLVREFELPLDTGPLRVRLYDPSPASVKPVLIYIHGGGWSMFSLDTHDRLMREYAHRAGVAVLGVDYALAPEYKYPYALHQVLGALHWLLAEADALGIDGGRVALGGDSAGANLALATALVQREAGQGDTIAGLLLNYGGFDATVDAESRRRFGTGADMLSSAEIDMFWLNYLRDDADQQDPLACPLKANLGGLPPSLLIVPECDVLAAQSLAMDERMREAGVDVQCKIYQGAVHSFLEAMSTSTVANRAIEDTATWLRQRLRDEGMPAG
ncbi:alpha/beta hydrolase fold domain-containing protein [Rhodanobacter sp. MP1X3]|uniref:alpha/beta hydrolase fold domain-containing protein n=1 Tax=Rhodanobacter sp. MP1X3 TaxID=2723086 RepID=UPI001615B5EE|nr:alpha/beta hydrolase fold domain-containing protein [Rhodanobacter sp. MP1X3]MBB6244921.1 acetyl esterase/lipase/predicted FMN-binding regulatory protein PaiB [Rhodanobacter sp. MP1X3]